MVLRGPIPMTHKWGGDKLYAISYATYTEQLIESFNQGRAIINYAGHGDTTFWDGPKFLQSDVKNLEETTDLPFVVSNSCLTGYFREKESFAETWLTAPNGAIMFWGSMGSTYWDEDDILQVKMWEGIVNKKLRKFSQIADYALREVWRYYNGAGKSKYYWETYHLFGDASMNLRLKE